VNFVEGTRIEQDMQQNIAALSVIDSQLYHIGGMHEYKMP
jgi:hypothetical protein